jgi:hypothetical protein
MRNHKVIAVCALGAVTALMAAGCKVGNGTSAAPAAQAQASASPSANPTEEFTAALKALTTTTFRATSVVTQGPETVLRGDVTADPAADSFTMETTMPIFKGESIRMLGVQGDMFVKYPKGVLHADGKKWWRVDAKRVPSQKLGVEKMNDPSASANLLTMLVSVEKESSGRFRGRFDFSRSAMPSIKQAVELFGDNAKSVQFEATVDDKARITTLTYELAFPAHSPAATPTTSGVVDKPMQYKTTYSDYGLKVNIVKPSPSEVVNASDEFYKSFNA